jgi:hypothetical protein
VDKDRSGGVTFAEFFDVFNRELAILEKTHAVEDFDPDGHIGRTRLGKLRLFAVLLRRTVMQKIRMHGYIRSPTVPVVPQNPKTEPNISVSTNPNLSAECHGLAQRIRIA